MAVTLVIVRHGESTANRDNEFTGWSDVPLTPKGYQQAHQVGLTLQHAGILFDGVHTSLLKRAISTSNVILEDIHQLWLPVNKSWRLNERHYGALRGKNKDDAREFYGKSQVALWRRSYTAIPPLLSTDDLTHERRYRHIEEPLGESLSMASARLLPYWQDVIAPALRDGKNQLVVAHGSTLRALIKLLEEIRDEDIDGLEIGNGEPIAYYFDDDFQMSERHYLMS